MIYGISLEITLSVRPLSGECHPRGIKGNLPHFRGASGAVDDPNRRWEISLHQEVYKRSRSLLRSMQRSQHNRRNKITVALSVVFVKLY